MLVSGAASSQDKLAQAAQSSANTITQLTDVVKLGATSIGSDDPETQVVLINAVKDVAKALAELIGATKCASGKPAGDPSMYQLKSCQGKKQSSQSRWHSTSFSGWALAFWVQSLGNMSIGLTEGTVDLRSS
ncbi:talin-2 isoform X1 [Acipenser oxyrinchus oxyrinchus]|uniref:Talin-2 isoform X1 n=1 Tax=Acipenser oxyrinchus oxyrinchus TaxID=40147 RepID=A0AAD8CWG7_ACIOX|nr:talin-2 isoform X1 [Acipenser oxyrinchus oxyrinchus]